MASSFEVKFIDENYEIMVDHRQESSHVFRSQFLDEEFKETSRHFINSCNILSKMSSFAIVESKFHLFFFLLIYSELVLLSQRTKWQRLSKSVS